VDPMLLGISSVTSLLSWDFLSLITTAMRRLALLSAVALS
jgi:hypothetical protein